MNRLDRVLLLGIQTMCHRVKIVLTVLLAMSFAPFCLAPAHNPVSDMMYPVVSGYPYAIDIARDPNDVPPTPLPDNGTITLTMWEVPTYVGPANSGAAWVGDGTDVMMRYLAFGGGHPGQDQAPRVPGPFLRLKEGRTVTIKVINNAPNDGFTHSVDLHAVIGKKGGGAVLSAPPGGSAQFTFTANNPGLYVYHCVGNGSPHTIAHHMNNGMAGLVLVEPASPTNDFIQKIQGAKEFYVFQTDMWVSPPKQVGLLGPAGSPKNPGGSIKNPGNLHGGSEHPGGGGGPATPLLDFDEKLMFSGAFPTYTVFNGRIGSLFDHPLQAQTGQNAVIYFGTTGGHISSPHMIGEIFDWVYDQGGLLNPPLQSIQTSLVPVAGSSVLIMDGAHLVPSNAATGDVNIFVDHSTPHLRAGAMGIMNVQ